MRFNQRTKRSIAWLLLIIMLISVLPGTGVTVEAKSADAKPEYGMVPMQKVNDVSGMTLIEIASYDAARNKAWVFNPSRNTSKDIIARSTDAKVIVYLSKSDTQAQVILKVQAKDGLLGSWGNEGHYIVNDLKALNSRSKPFGVGKLIGPYKNLYTYVFYKYGDKEWDNGNGDATGFVLKKSTSSDADDSYNYDNIVDIINAISSKQSKTESDYYILNYLLGFLADNYSDDLSDLYNSNGVFEKGKEAKLAWSSVKQDDGLYISNGNDNTFNIVCKISGRADEDMSEFRDMLDELAAAKVSLSDCTLLSGILDVYKAVREEAEKKADEKAEDDAYQKILGEIPNDPHGRWAWLMNYYKVCIQRSQTYRTVSSSLPDYKLHEFPNSGESISEEEKLRLMAYFYAQTKLSRSGVNTAFTDSEDNDEDGNTTESLNVDNAVWNVSGTGTYSEVSFGNSNPYTAEYVKETADAIVEEYSQGMGSANGMLGYLIPSIDAVVKYYAAQMYGFTVANATASGGAQDETKNMMNLTQCAYIEQISPSITTAIETLVYDYHGVSKMENMDSIKGTPEAYEAYLRIIYYMMLTANYAENNAKLQSTNNGTKYINPDIEGFKTSKGNKVELVTDRDLASISKYVIEYTAINDALTYLGMEPFTDQLKAIVDYAGYLEQFKDRVKEVYSGDYETEGEAMKSFFSVQSSTLSDDYKTGVELSATYIPMQTNVYDINSIRMLDDYDWVQRFHYPFGFYRKALYIDTNVNAALNGYITERVDRDTRIATLNDLLQPEKDIVLYMDTNFYNVNKLADITGMYYNNLMNAEGSAKDSDATTFGGEFFNLFAEAGDRDIESVVKTGGNNAYSRNVKNKVAKYGSKSKDKLQGLIMSDEEIDSYLTGYSEDNVEDVYDNYTVMQPYAVVSAIYRQQTLFSILKKQVASNDPIFVSSPNLAGTTGVSYKEFNSIYNYAMLRNLEQAVGIDADTVIDKNSPLYIDIYGNILTESGLVVIPAMSNATLCDGESYNLATVGFVHLYSSGDYRIPEGYKNAEAYISPMLTLDEETHTYELGSKRVNNVYINFNQLPISDLRALTTVKYIAQMSLSDDTYLPFAQHVYMITEVMRGAPIDCIDKDFEGIGRVTISKTGIYFAEKLEELAKMLLSSTSGNSLIELPNLAFLDGVEYVILFLYKIIFAASLALLFYRLYIDAVQGQLGFKSIGGFVVSIVMFLVIAFSIPSLLDISYYQVNKNLLQQETEYIAMLNYEKSKEGREIGITTVRQPESETELYLKIDDVSVPWYSIVDDVLFKSTFKTVGEIYKEEMSQSILSHLPGTFQKGNGLYMTVTDILDASDVVYDPDTNQMYTSVKDVPYASYIVPYYVILDTLVARINNYNSQNSIREYTPKIMGAGSVEPCGMIEPFFTSKYFMQDSQDVLGLKYVEGLKTTLDDGNIFTQDDIARMSYSLWYRTEEDDKDIYDKLDAIDKDARMFVVNNRNLLGKVSDETFLKVMSLAMAVKYNDTLNVSAGNAIEIYDIDARDIIKLSLADKDIVLRDTSKSFARFVYDNSGVLGVVMTAFLLVVYFVSSFIKPVLIFLILGSMIAAAVLRKTVKRDTSGAIEGLFITAAILAGTNILYAVLLKGSLMIPELGVNMVVSCVIQMILQIVYLLLLVLFTSIVLSDWKSLGFNKYMRFATSLAGAIKFGRFKSKNTYVHARRSYNKSDHEYKKNNRGQKSYDRENKDDVKRATTGEDILEIMKSRDEEIQGRKERR